MQVNKVYEGDCLDVMKQLPDNCIDTILTDPPYGLEFMGKNWDHGIPGIAYWVECLRVAKPGATLMAFGGTRTYHRLACAIEDAGWEIRDCVSYFHDGSQAERALMASLNKEQLAAYLELHYPNGQMSWVYGSGIGLGYNVGKGIDKSKGAEREVVGISPNSRFNNNTMYANGSGIRGHESYTGDSITAPATPLAAKFEGWNTRLKPSFEPIVLAMKPIDKNYAHNAEKWGVAGMWIDGGRVATNEETIERDFDKQKQTTGEYGRYGKFSNNSVGIWKNTNGRYPANTILDGSEEVEKEFAKAGVRPPSARPNSSGKYYGSNSKIYGKFEGKNYKSSEDYIKGPPSRYFQHCPPDEPARLIYQAKAPQSERSTPGNNHPTQKPLSLIRYLAKLSKTPDGGIVLDPFGGSGTTAIAAIAEGREYILIEKEPEYCEIIKRRIAEYTGQEIAPKEVEIQGETVKQIPLW